MLPCCLFLAIIGYLGCRLCIRDWAPVLVAIQYGMVMSPFFRNPRPTWASCRGRKCTSDVNRDIYHDWSLTQWKSYSLRSCCGYDYHFFFPATLAPPLRHRPFPFVLGSHGSLFSLAPPPSLRGAQDRERETLGEHHQCCQVGFSNILKKKPQKFTFP